MREQCVVSVNAHCEVVLNTLAWNDLDLLPQHIDVLRSRGITPDVARAHGYRSSRGENDLRKLGYKGAIASVSGALVIPLHDADGDVCGHQIRPDDEVAGDKPGEVLRYLTPPGQSNVVDIPVWMGARGRDTVTDPDTSIIVTEGPLKAASAASRGIPCVSIQGVSSYVGKSASGGRGVYLPDWRQFASNRHWVIGYDSDAMTKPEVLREAQRLGAYLGKKPGSRVTYLVLPGASDKVGLDDWLVQHPDAGLSELYSMTSDELPDPDAVDLSAVDDGIELVPATDLDVSDSYVNKYGNQVRYLTDLGKWVGYSDGRWDLSGGDSVARSNAQTLFRDVRAYRVVSDGQGGTRRVDAGEWLYSATRLDACLAQVRSNPKTQARADDLNQSPMLLNVANGTVELVSGILGPHDPRDLLTQKTDVPYDQSATAPEFARFIRQVLPDEDVRSFVQRLFGMALLGEVRDHVFTVFTGTGRNGKGVLLRIAQAVFGDYATGIHKDLLVKTNFEGHPTHLATLYGRRLAVAQELERGAKWDVSKVKELTGGDSVTARWMRGNDFTFTPSHTIIMSSNHRPAVGEGERAFWIRYREVPFTVSFEGREDTTLADRIIAHELPGVLQWMLQGLSLYLSDGLGSPDAVTKASREAQEESDPLLRFVHERMIVTGDDADRLPTREVYDAWQKWAATEGDHIQVGSYLRFGRTLTGATSALTSTQGRYGELSKVSLIVGVKWKTPDDDSVHPIGVVPVENAEVATPSAEVVRRSNAEVQSGFDQQVYEFADVADVKPEIHSIMKPFTETKGEISPFSGQIETTSAPPQSGSEATPYPVTDSESSVSTGLLADGSVNPEYTIRQGQEVGTELVSYEEYKRRMKLAGKWSDPTPGWVWEDVA